MPDTNGLPTVSECYERLLLVQPDVENSQLLLKVLTRILSAVVLRFQSPPGRMGNGGTGRFFVPTSATRYYSGTGFPRLAVDDIVPGNAIGVTAFGVPLLYVVLEEAEPGEGHNVLVRQQPGAFTPFNGDLYPGVFPVGEQNIAVTTLFGFAALVPDDVREAIECEVVYQGLVSGVIGVNGVGSMIEVDDFQYTTSVGAINWAVSSPVSVFHNTYLDTVRAYRKPRTMQTQRIVQRTS